MAKKLIKKLSAREYQFLREIMNMNIPELDRSGKSKFWYKQIKLLKKFGINWMELYDKAIPGHFLIDL